MTGWALALLAASLCTFEGLASAAPTRSETLIDAAQATVPDLGHGAALYRANCAHCHYSRGNGVGDREFPQLSGQREDYLLTQLARFVTHERDGPKMQKVLATPGLSSPRSLHDLAAFLAAEPHYSHGEHGDGHFLGTGRRLYHDRCEGCHGAAGEGRSAGPTPSISGQNYAYLVAQLKGFTAGHRATTDVATFHAMGPLSSEDMGAVADFISRLPESADPQFGVIER